MAKLFNQNKGNEIIPRALIFDTSLSDRARFVYCYMSAKPEGWDFVLEPMAKELKYSPDTLRKYLKELTDSGWVTRGGQRKDENTNKFGPVEYTINSKPYRKKPDTEKTRDGKIPTQDNNSSINTPLIKEDNSTILNSPVNKKEEKRLSDDNRKNKRFVKPTIEQIQAYIDEKKLHFDAERFFDYYESKGWMVGKNHMKDWKAACRTWENMRKGELRKEDKEETKEPEMSEAEAITWHNCQEWMTKKVPGLAGRIRYSDFCEMRALAHFKSDVYADILVEIEKSGCEGSIVDEFDYRCQGAYYHRIWGNG